MDLLLANSSKKRSYSISRVSKWSSIWKKIFCPVLKEKETLPNFYRRFLQLKAQALEVSDEEVIAEAIKPCARAPYTVILSESGPK
jgi:hypothetical protein